MPKYPRAPRTRTARSLPRLHGASVRHESAVARPRNRDARRPPAAARDGSCGPRLVVRDVPTALRSRSSRLKLFRPQPELLSLAMMRYGTPGDGLQGPIGRRAALGRTVAFRPRVCGGSRLRSCHKAIAAAEPPFWSRKGHTQLPITWQWRGTGQRDAREKGRLGKAGTALTVPTCHTPGRYRLRDRYSRMAHQLLGVALWLGGRGCRSPQRSGDCRHEAHQC